MHPWLQMLSPMMNFRFPASGDMLMDYRPWTNWANANPNAGSPEIEDQVFRNVALPGKQLGKLIDAVTELIRLVASEHPEIREQYPAAFSTLEEMAGEITRKKLDLQNTMQAEAQRCSTCFELRIGNPSTRWSANISSHLTRLTNSRQTNHRDRMCHARSKAGSAPLNRAGRLPPARWFMMTARVDINFATGHQAAGHTALASVEEGTFVDGRWFHGRRLNGDETDHDRTLRRVLENPYRIYRVTLYQRP